jgi:hypothetical protein
MSTIFNYKDNTYVYSVNPTRLQKKTQNGLTDLPLLHPAVRQIIDKAESLNR